MGCPGCKKSRRFPPYRDMIKSLSVTMVNCLRHAVVNGEIKAEKIVIERRLDACRRCKYFTGKRCEQCGCYVITKAGLKVSKCPMNYWED